jgi:hypothetical protein
MQDHLVLENFKEEDYQFKSHLFNSGFKIYHEDGNSLKQKYLLFESRAVIDNLKPNIDVPGCETDKQDPIFTSQDLHSLFERQIITMMNMVPYKDMYNSTNILSLDDYDLLTPLQLLKGNSLSDLMLNDDVYIKDGLTDKTTKESISDTIAENLQSIMLKFKNSTEQI